MPLEAYLNNMFGDAKDPTKGRQMPDHYGAPRRRGSASISSPVGTQITQAVGFAWAAKMKKDDVATLVYFGEGATSSGEFHNGMNFAGVFKTPTRLLLSQQRLGDQRARRAADRERVVRRQGGRLRHPGVQCDGNDLFAVIKVTREAVARAAPGEGPTLIEALTDAHAGTRRATPEGLPEGATDAGERRTRSPASAGISSRAASGRDAKQRELEAKVARRDRRGHRGRREARPPALATMFDDVYAALTLAARGAARRAARGTRAPAALAKP